MGTVELEIPKQIHLSYIVAEQPPFDFALLQETTIPAGTKWKVADNNQCYGWDLEFAQDKGDVILKYSYAPCYLRDLGKGEVVDFINVSKSKIRQNEFRGHKAKNGHVYLVDQQAWKRWILFKIAIE